MYVSTTTVGSLGVTSAVTLGGQLALVAENGYIPTSSQIVTVIQRFTSIVGQFSDAVAAVTINSGSVTAVASSTYCVSSFNSSRCLSGN